MGVGRYCLFVGVVLWSVDWGCEVGFDWCGGVIVLFFIGE